jgi:hypothetical protein
MSDTLAITFAVMAVATLVWWFVSSRVHGRMTR